MYGSFTFAVATRVRFASGGLSANVGQTWRSGKGFDLSFEKPWGGGGNVIPSHSGSLD